jgi:hypothetical protein
LAIRQVKSHETQMAILRTGIFDNYSHTALRVTSGRQRNISGQSLAVRPMREKIEQLDLSTDAIANGF